MNPHKLNQRQQEQNDVARHISAERGLAREFVTPEELLRHDAAGTAPPASVAQRLEESVCRETPARPWWRRLFGR